MEQQNNRSPKATCIVAVTCLLVPMIYTFFLDGILLDMLATAGLVGILVGIIIEMGMLPIYIIGLILMIDTRIKHPQYEWGKVVMAIYIIGSIIFLGIIANKATACYDCITCGGFWEHGCDCIYY